MSCKFTVLKTISTLWQRTLCLLMLPALFCNAANAQDRLWQQITDPSAGEVAANFLTPPVEYGLTQWWGWDGPMDETVIKRDLDAFKARGVKIVTIEPGYDMPAAYLSPGWFELVKIAVGQAKQRDMRVWIVDEGKYPSGFAGGKFSRERPDLLMQALVAAERITPKNGETITRKLAPETIGAVAVNQTDQTNQIVDVKSGTLNWTTPAAGNWQILLIQHQFKSSDTRSVNNPTRGKDTTNALFDYLNPAATRQFLAFTHEQYKKVMGEEFGKTILGFRGDEPDYSINGIPWTPAIFDEFQKKKGYDVKPYIAAFFAPHLTEEQQRVKADYWDVWSDLFRDNFFKVQADWCAENKMQYLVHLNHEDELMKLVRSEGDFFKNMRDVGMPGIDAIWSQIWMDKVSDFPKLASSAAHLFGKPRAFTESFAAYRPPPNPEQALWIINQQMVRGINMIEVMFQSSTAIAGRGGPRGWIASDEFPGIVSYVNRASYLLSNGRPTAQIAVYMPTTSLWFGDEDANKSALSIAQKLLERQYDFDFVDERTLESVLKSDKGELRNLSGQGYQAVIVPSVGVMSKTALNRLQAFQKAGGKVIFLGAEPSRVTEKSFLKASAITDLNWAVREPSGDLTTKVVNVLPAPDVKFDQLSASVKYLHRRWKDADVYFFFNESAQKQTARVTLSGSGTAQIWDASNGKIIGLNDVGTKGKITLPLILESYQTRFMVIGGRASRQ